MKAKWSIAIAVVLVVLAVKLVMTLRSEPPIQVLGGLSEREVADIRAAVLRKIRPPILPDFSVQSLRGAPGAILRRFTKADPRISTIEARTHGFVAVISAPWVQSDSHRYAFWSVFRGTNSWWVAEEYHLERY